jgi:antitoxin component HigA of HigAB toxin-antitoxin module
MSTASDKPTMTIETNEDYEMAIERLNALGDDPANGPDQDEFFEINAAMVEYETRHHRAAVEGAEA